MFSSVIPPRPYRGFMCAHGDRFSSRADANWSTFAHKATLEDMWTLSGCILRSHTKSALWYLIQDNRSLRTNRSPSLNDLHPPRSL